MIGSVKNSWWNNAGQLITARLPGESTTPEYYIIHAGNTNNNSMISSMGLWPFFQGGIHRFDPNTLVPEYFLECDNTTINAYGYRLLEYGGKLLIGGNFTNLAGDTSLDYLVEYDGATSFSLFQGVAPSSIVVDMVKTGGTAFGSTGDLYIGGQFQNYNGNPNSDRIVKWDGSSFSNLGSGINNQVSTLALDSSGNLYAAGYFTTAGGVAANRIAKWDGSSWSALGTGLAANDGTLKLWVDSNDDLYITGSFTTIGGVSANRFAKWDGSSWSQAGNFNSHIAGSYKDPNSDDFYFLGSFTTVNGVTVNGVAKWDGATFTALNDPITTVRGERRPYSSNTSSPGAIYLSPENDLYIAFLYLNQGDCWIDKLPSGATSWVAADSWPGRTPGNLPQLRDLTKYEGKIYLAGYMGPMIGSNGVIIYPQTRAPLYYDRSSGNIKTDKHPNFAEDSGRHGIRFWWDENASTPRIISYVDGRILDPNDSGSTTRYNYWNASTQQWVEFGKNNGASIRPVRIGDYLYVGANSGGAQGDFLSGYRIKKYDIETDTYTNIGTMDGFVAIDAITTDGTDLYVGGTFTTVGGVTVNRIAKYSPSSNTWYDIEGSTGANNTVYALECATGDSMSTKIFASGLFTSIQGVSVNGIAVYDTGTRQWTGVGGGLGGTINTVNIIDKMSWDHANQCLYVSGPGFTSLGGQTLRSLAKWDEAGATWSDVGEWSSMHSTFRTHPNAFMHHFDKYTGKLCVFGYFSGLYAGYVYNNVAFWDGASWDNFAQYEGQNGHTGAGIHYYCEYVFPIPAESGLTFNVEND